MLERLAAFADCGYSIQAPAARTLLGAIALVALSGGAPGSTVNPDPGAPLAREGYGRLVDNVQDAVDRAFGEGRIIMLDRSAAPADEFARVRGMLPERRAVQAIATMGDGAGAYNASLELDPDGVRPWTPAFQVTPGTICLVAGAQPRAGVADALGTDTAPAGMRTEAAHRWAVWREVGHCLVGASKLAAETFAAMMARRSGDPAGLVAAMAGVAPSEGEFAGRRVALTAVAALPAAATPDAETTSIGSVAAAAARIALDAIPRTLPAPRTEAGPAAATVSPASLRTPAPAEDDDEDDAPASPRPF